MSHKLKLILQNRSEDVIANILEDVENVNARDYFISFNTNSIYKAIEAIIEDSSLEPICKDPISIYTAAKKISTEQIEKTASLKFPDAIKNLFTKEMSKKNKFLY